MATTPCTFPPPPFPRPSQRALLLLAVFQLHLLPLLLDLARLRKYRTDQVQWVVHPRVHDVEHGEGRDDNLFPHGLRNLVLALGKVDVAHLFERPEIGGEFRYGQLVGVQAHKVPRLESEFTGPGEGNSVGVGGRGEGPREIVVLGLQAPERFEVEIMAAEGAFAADGDIIDSACRELRTIDY
jgi:hypothetical protein